MIGTWCPRCRTSQPPGAAFCDSCGSVAGSPGTSTAGLLACLHCGAGLLHGVAFCDECGAATSAAASTGPSEPVRPNPLPPAAPSATTARPPSTLANAARTMLGARESTGGTARAKDVHTRSSMDGRPVATRTSPPAQPTIRPSTRPASSSGAIRLRTLFVGARAVLGDANGRKLLDGLRMWAGGVEILIVDDGDDALVQVQARLEKLGAGSSFTRVDAVCLLGSDATLPHARVNDSTGHDDAVLTDNFFGRTSTPDGEDDFACGDLLADVPVSRLPYDDAETLLAMLERAPDLHGHWNDGVMVSCEVWRGASAAVAEHIGVTRELHLAPPVDDDFIEQLLQEAPGRLYFNVHGTDQEPVWVGQGHNGNMPVVIRPELIQVADGAVVVSEACYGAACFEGEEGIGQAFLARGANAFYGSTIIAWGPLHAPPGMADLVPMNVFTNLDANESAGKALWLAKQAICAQYLARDDVLAPSVQNTLLSFCHYGWPWCRSTSSSPRKSAPRPAPSLPGADVVVRKQESVLAAVRAGGSVLGRVRGKLADKAREQGWGVDAFVRGPLDELSATLGPLSPLLDRLRIPEGEGAQGSLVRYRTRVGERISLIVGGASKNSTRHGLIADGEGRVIEEFVARSSGSARTAGSAHSEKVEQRIVTCPQIFGPAIGFAEPSGGDPSHRPKEGLGQPGQ